MGILTGYLCLFSLCFLLLKAITRKMSWQKADALLMKAHKYFCAFFLIFCFLHLILVIPVFKTRAPAVFITGIAAALTFLLIVSVYHKLRKDHKIMLHWHRIITLFILLFVIGHIASYYVDFITYQRKVNNIHLPGINMDSLADGQYIGKYDVGYIDAKVCVTVLQGKLAAITLLEHNNEKGAKAEKIINIIMETQKFPVDAISGATNSSKVIQGAILDALQNEPIAE